MGKKIKIFNLSTRRNMLVDRNKLKKKKLKNGAIALVGKVGGVKVSKIIAGSKTGRRR